MSIANHPDPAPPRGALSLALPAALALAAAMGIGRFAFTPVWPLMAQETGLSLAQGSWLASANYAGYLLGALAAAVQPPHHPRAMLAVSLLAVALLTLAMPWVHGVLAWSLLRLAAGYGSASAFICVAAARPVAPGDPRAPAVSAITYAGVGAGIALTGLACLALMASGASANANWTALGALTLALSALAWPGLNRPAPARHLAAAPAPGRLPPGIGRLARRAGGDGTGHAGGGGVAQHRRGHRRRAAGGQHIHDDHPIGHDGRAAASRQRRAAGRGRHDIGLRRRPDHRAAAGLGRGALGR